MGQRVSIGKNTLGSGGKMTTELRGYGRSTHDLGYIWRSSMAAGTIVPFMSMVGLPGDTWDIKLRAEVMTHPTVGPLFGSYKVQCDVFQVPIRLYVSQLHNNKTEIGLKMSNVKLPQMTVTANASTDASAIDNQINPSSILAYLGIRGIGRPNTGDPGPLQRNFNAVPYIGYYDIVKNYYANKQEELGVIIHADRPIIPVILGVDYITTGGTTAIPQAGVGLPGVFGVIPAALIKINYAGGTILGDDDIVFNTSVGLRTPDQLYLNKNVTATYTDWYTPIDPGLNIDINSWTYADASSVPIKKPTLTNYYLRDVDRMREQLVEGITQFTIDATDVAPFSLALQYNAVYNTTAQQSQEGLCVKTYQSDVNNNWMRTEWIDGTTGINAITSIDTTSGKFSIDALNLANKIYLMLNRVALSGGTYDDWVETVYDVNVYKRATTPVYLGGLSRELVFQEVVSNSATDTQPLGQLAGKGVMSGKNKGGYINVKLNELSYIMGMVSITPRIDYSQGNEWDMLLKTVDDFHKPQLDEIGFQDLITDTLAYFDTRVNPNSDPATKNYILGSAGKQPAWINYMTNKNKTFGNFAIPENEMFMTLNRRYEKNALNGIKDMTTYIDPSKYNYIFAETSLDSQNFWTQLGVDIDCRRKMSAKVIPNL